MKPAPWRNGVLDLRTGQLVACSRGIVDACTAAECMDEQISGTAAAGYHSYIGVAAFDVGEWTR